MRVLVLLFALLASSCAARQRCCHACPLASAQAALPRAVRQAPAPKSKVILTVMVVGRYGDQPGMLTIGGTDHLISYNLADDMREGNFKEIEQRFVALHKAKPDASVTLILDTTPEWQPRPPELQEVLARLRKAGFKQVDITYESLEGKSLSRES